MHRIWFAVMQPLKQCFKRCSCMQVQSATYCPARASAGARPSSALHGRNACRKHRETRSPRSHLCIERMVCFQKPFSLQSESLLLFK